MEPLQIKSKTNTKLKSILWGTLFILLGLAMGAAMIGLIVTEGFSFIYVFGMLLFTLFIWAGFASIHLRKYTLELLADDKGIHYYDYDSKFGYGKHEFIIPWETIKAVMRYTDRDFDPEDWEYEALSIQSLDEISDPTVIWLDDAKITSDNIDDTVSKLNEMRIYYENKRLSETYMSGW